MDEPPPLPGEKTRRRKRRRRTLLTVLLVVVAAVVALVGIGVFYVLNTEELEVTDADRAAVLDAQDLEAFFAGVDAATFDEEWSSLEYMDGSRELEVTSENEDLFSYCTLARETDAVGAKIAYEALELGLSFGLSADEVKLGPDRDGFQWGSESRDSLVLYEGSPSGAYFSCRQGERVFSLILTGVVLEDGDLEELLTPVLESWEEWGD